MTYSIHDIAKVICNSGQPLTDQQINYLVIDSRQVLFPSQTLFFALSSERRDGHAFIAQLVEQGVKSFVVRKGFNHSAFSGLNFLEVDDVLIALQELTGAHRKFFNSLSNGKLLPVIGITGSNGKTIVKEWLYQLLAPDFRVVRSPRSFNSQIGVPLSVWQINEQHTLGIFEAGISTINEMERLENIILPNIGVLTNLGEAHAEGFSNRLAKLTEKLKLFVHAKQLVVALDSLLPNEQNILKIQFPNAFSWSRVDAANLQVVCEIVSNQCTHIRALVHEQEHQITIPFTDQISIDNAVTCWSVLIVLGYSNAIIQERMLLLEPVDMRMQLKSGINNCYLINDSYSNDLSSLSLALAYLKQQAGNKKTTIILSDILQAVSQTKKCTSR